MRKCREREREREREHLAAGDAAKVFKKREKKEGI
jgi:hypothetical protein